MNNFSRKKLDVLANIGIIIVLVSLFVVSSLSLTTIEAISYTENYPIYYKGSQENKVSLMFNVYWGTEYLDGILKVLSDYNVKCTFFIGGSWADDNLDYLKKIVNDGHELGNHGYFHKNQSQLSYDQNFNEINATNVLIKTLINYDVKLFAPPSGDYSEITLKAATNLNMKIIMWSKDTIDWRDKDSNLIYNRATQNIVSGDLILMHPTEKTLEALTSILQYYIDNKFEEVTVSQNITLTI